MSIIIIILPTAPAPPAKLDPPAVVTPIIRPRESIRPALMDLMRRNATVPSVLGFRNERTELRESTQRGFVKRKREGVEEAGSWLL
mmetsp:Transcript_7272/g.13221  ORF Transcript_7272/g.13221 Transcript_7272/m.13221 type:complete len:86 (+) Transcript_7272:407-664(+)